MGIVSPCCVSAKIGCAPLKILKLHTSMVKRKRTWNNPLWFSKSVLRHFYENRANQQRDTCHWRHENYFLRFAFINLISYTLNLNHKKQEKIYPQRAIKRCKRKKNLCIIVCSHVGVKYQNSALSPKTIPLYWMRRHVHAKPEHWSRLQ